MKTKDLDFNYPSELVATEPRRDYRVLLHSGSGPKEIPQVEIPNIFNAGDVLVINDTRVLKRRVFTEDGVEILFLNANENNPKEWQVLFPARDLKIGDRLTLPQGLIVELLSKGLPQTVKVIQSGVDGGCEYELSDDYFKENAHLALPPYIQKARGERIPTAQDENWYQTAWAKNAGSLAAPTASLHFSANDLKNIEARGVKIVKLTLHVGIGTFLPIKVDNLNEHQMHKEWVEIPAETIAAIQNAKKNGHKVWGLGTTVVRSLESWAHGKLQTVTADSENKLSGVGSAVFGHTDLFIKPGFEFKVVDGILTNFHQPQSSLMALVAAFAGLENVQKAYSYAIDHRFRLLSYGDLSIWTK